MTFKTFTRKPNALAAASRDLASVVNSNALGFELFVTGTDAANIGFDAESKWVARIYIDSHTAEEHAQVVAALPNYEIVNTNPKEEVMLDTAPAAETTETAAETTKARKGRAPSLAGRKLFPTVKADKDGAPINPRRTGSHGHRSLQIIIDKPGITVEDFVAAGGRLNDLRWDIEHNNCEAKL